MIGYGRSAQFLMTSPMSNEHAREMAEKYARQAEHGAWIRINGTYVNPRNITTIKIMKERDCVEAHESVRRYDRQG